MTIDSKCQFCKTSLCLEVDDSYAGLGDPYGLIKLACCNRCSDLRERCRRLHESFVRICAALIASPKDSDVRSKAREVLCALTKRYVALISEWTGQILPWEEAMAGPFMADPNKLSFHIKRLWSLTKQQQFGL